MSDNKLVGSLVLRTIDKAPTRNSPVSLASSVYDDDIGTSSGNGGVITWNNVNKKIVWGDYIINLIDLIWNYQPLK